MSFGPFLSIKPRRHVKFELRLQALIQIAYQRDQWYHSDVSWPVNFRKFCLRPPAIISTFGLPFYNLQKW